MSYKRSSHYKPLSPHLTIYKPQITSILSILHRGTGIVLFLANFIIISWVLSVAIGREAYDILQTILLHPMGLIILAGWSFSFFYHLSNGFRHLLWDLGWGYEMQQVRLTGWIMIVTSLLLTVLLWLYGMGAIV